MDRTAAADQLIESALKLADAAANAAPSYAESYASAARQLAEASAWIRDANQAH